MAASPSEYYRSASVADARSAARSPKSGPLPPLSISLVHASPQGNVPELVGYLRHLGCDVSIIVVESGARGFLQKLYTGALYDSMIAPPTAIEKSWGKSAYSGVRAMSVSPAGQFEASYPFFFCCQ